MNEAPPKICGDRDRSRSRCRKSGNQALATRTADERPITQVQSQDPKFKRSDSGTAQAFVPPDAASVAFQHVASLVARFTQTPDSSKLVFVMVGLPARGKSFISMRLARFLQWTGTQTRSFNVGKHRRSTETGKQDASYFDPNSKASQARREELAMDVLTEMVNWLEAGKERFAIFDATNTTKARRQRVAEHLSKTDGLGVIFIESICSDPAILEANMVQKLSKSADYESMSKTTARKDFEDRIGHYKKVYEPVHEEIMNIRGVDYQISYIKLFNFSSHVEAHNIWGRAASRELPFLMALHIGSRPIWLVRLPHAVQTAQSYRRVQDAWPPPPDIIFCEQPISNHGANFADALATFAKREAPGMVVFSCTHRRGLDVMERIGPGRVRTSLNPQERGAGNGLSPAEIASQFPKVSSDPMKERFPGGESISDMIQRLTPTLIEVEQEMRPVMVVAPLSVLQVIYCYYAGRDVAESLTIKLPMHSVVEFKSDGSGGGNFCERCLLLGELIDANAKSAQAPG